MPIDKVGFSGVDHTLPLSSSQSKRDKVPNELTESSDNEISNASKYMIGAAALAGVVALGIIGHKNNWWRKASQAAEDLKPKIPKESPEPPHTPNTHCTEEVSVTNTPQVNNNNASKVGSKSSAADSGNTQSAERVPEAETGNPKPSEQAQAPEVQTGNPHNVVDTQVDYSDISKIRGDRTNFPDGAVTITQKDKSGNVVREFYSQDGRTVCEVNEYDPTTKKHIRTIGVREDGTREYIINRAQEGNHAVMTCLRKDGKTPESIHTLDSKGKPVKITYLREDGKTPKLIANFDSKGEPVEITFFGENGETPAARVYRVTNTENDCNRVEMLNPDGSSKCVFDITSDSNKFEIISGTITEKDVPYIKEIFDEIDKLL